MPTGLLRISEVEDPLFYFISFHFIFLRQEQLLCVTAQAASTLRFTCLCLLSAGIHHQALNFGWMYFPSSDTHMCY